MESEFLITPDYINMNSIKNLKNQEKLNIFPDLKFKIKNNDKLEIKYEKEENGKKTIYQSSYDTEIFNHMLSPQIKNIQSVKKIIEKACKESVTNFKEERLEIQFSNPNIEVLSFTLNKEKTESFNKKKIIYEDTYNRYRYKIYIGRIEREPDMYIICQSNDDSSFYYLCVDAQIINSMSEGFCTDIDDAKKKLKEINQLNQLEIKPGIEGTTLIFRYYVKLGSISLNKLETPEYRPPLPNERVGYGKENSGLGEDMSPPVVEPRPDDCLVTIDEYKDIENKITEIESLIYKNDNNIKIEVKGKKIVDDKKKDNLSLKIVRNSISHSRDSLETCKNIYNDYDNDLKYLNFFTRRLDYKISICKQLLSKVGAPEKRGPIIRNPKELKNSIDSRIVTKQEEFDLINDKLQKRFGKKKIKYVLVYRASRDGDKTKIWQRKVLDIKRTLTVIHTKNNRKFGGYTEKEWYDEEEEEDIRKKDPYAFCFSIDLNKIYDIKENEVAIHCSNDNQNFDFGPCFYWTFTVFDKSFLRGGEFYGKDTSSFDLHDSEDYEMGGKPGEAHFDIYEIEVFKVEP